MDLFYFHSTVESGASIKMATRQVRSNLEFIQELRACVARYLAAVDAWETEYHRYYRLARPHSTVSPDLEDAQSAYITARRELETLTPRARRLCAKFEQRDPWPGLLRIELGAHAPQTRIASAFGRSERITIADCLATLELQCADQELKTESPPIPEPAIEPKQHRNLLQRVIDYFI
jgi:hypothetical protein